MSGLRALVEARLAIVQPDREALRRALAVLAMPQNVPLGARLGWRAADAMWRLAGDVATDFNHYTKRMTLSAVYATTIAVFIDDDSEGAADTHAFLARRIDNVMRFEKWKAGIKGPARTPAKPGAVCRAVEVSGGLGGRLVERRLCFALSRDISPRPLPTTLRSLGLLSVGDESGHFDACFLQFQPRGKALNRTRRQNRPVVTPSGRLDGVVCRQTGSRR